jgi:hypothetical protein
MIVRQGRVKKTEEKIPRSQKNKRKKNYTDDGVRNETEKKRANANSEMEALHTG